MPGPYGLGIFLCQLDHGFIRTRPANETFSRRLTKRQPKFDAWYSIHECFVNILDRLDEMGLSQNKIDGFRLFDGYSLDFHGLSPTVALCNFQNRLGWSSAWIGNFSPPATL